MRLSEQRMFRSAERLTRLLAVVAQTLTAGAHLGVVADVAAFVAGATRKGRHPARLFSSPGYGDTLLPAPERVSDRATVYQDPSRNLPRPRSYRRPVPIWQRPYRSVPSAETALPQQLLLLLFCTDSSSALDLQRRQRYCGKRCKLAVMVEGRQAKEKGGMKSCSRVNHWRRNDGFPAVEPCRGLLIVGGLLLDEGLDEGLGAHFR